LFVFRQEKSVVLFFLLSTLLMVAGCTRSDGGAGPDTMPPTVPSGLAITAVSPSEVKVSWRPSTDDRGVKGYRIYRNGAYLKTTDGTSMTDTGLKPKLRYCYKVSARDASGKESAQSQDVCAVL
jgi:chitodextrinase